ncbi:hypothetical protein [Massilia glaciei]|uniref:Uncharacterized protein n=1 Tax=Massilia glaciei TaxID=1524097 RepID=A0A2U2HAX5_9BURK|nr:hypothetical protein [Massilia glaciei]PWF39927.1 hypothetical protein C7C56_026460 [Massilia glaciei]
MSIQEMDTSISAYPELQVPIAPPSESMIRIDANIADLRKKYLLLSSEKALSPASVESLNRIEAEVVALQKKHSVLTDEQRLSIPRPARRREESEAEFDKI